jgi:ATP-dependent exoDNAse (exonuclease V) beta subunit
MTSDSDSSALDAADTAAREAALDPTRSFIVQAPAGSGKTTVLAQRYLQLLGHVAQPEEVLAITFTRKATGELRQRVLGALAGTLKRDSTANLKTMELAAIADQHHRALGTAPNGLANAASRLKIMTIDAWNMFLASRLPIAARSNVSLRVADDVSGLYRRAARHAITEAETSNDAELTEAIERVLERLDNRWDRLETLLGDMLAKRSHWLPRLTSSASFDLGEVVEASLRRVVAAELAAARDAVPAALLAEGHALAHDCVRFMAREQREINVDLDAFVQADAAPGREPTDVARWRGLAWFALRSDGGVRKPDGLNVRAGFPKDETAHKERGKRWLQAISQESRAVAALQRVRELPDAALDAASRAALADLARVLLFAAAMTNLLFVETGECDYVAVAGAARQALVEEGKPTDLALRLDFTLKHILVDEFQDTSCEQCALLATLTTDWSAGDGRTLFVVGDPMQSIYQFRGAEVGLFLQARAAGVGGVRLEPLELRRNFRSVAKLVDFANNTFGAVFPEHNDPREGAIRFLASAVGRPQANGSQSYEAGSVELRRVAPGDFTAEARHVAQEIERLQRERPRESIAVLGGSRAHVRAICAELRARAVPFNGVELTPLADTPIVRDLEALTRALMHHGDRTAWFALLRSPMIGLELPDLTHVAAAAEHRHVFDAMRDSAGVPGLSPAAAARVARAASVLQGTMVARSEYGLSAWVERTWLRLRGPAAAASDADLEVAATFFAALERLAAVRPGVTLESLERMLAELYAPSDEIREDGVTVMTVHQSKGLEFDHVFLPGIGRVVRGEGRELLDWLEAPRGDANAVGSHSSDDSVDRLIAPIAMSGEDRDRLGNLIQRARKTRLRHEHLRLLYVAMTRARQSLWVYVHPKANTSDGTKLSADTRSHLAVLWPAVANACAALTPLASADRAGATRSVAKLRRLPIDWEPPPVIAPISRPAQDASAQDEPLEYRWAGQTARHVGTVVHRALETIAKSRRLPSTAEVSGWRVALEAQLASLGVASIDLADAASRAVDAISRTLDDNQGRWILSGEHPQAASEVALSGHDRGRIINAVIDRMFVDRDGTRWIVDFKTSPHEGGAIDDFLEQQVERYRPQLERYARLARALGPEPVRAGLYFPLLRRWRECAL